MTTKLQCPTCVISLLNFPLKYLLIDKIKIKYLLTTELGRVSREKACVASVSAGFSACSRHFSLFGPRPNFREFKKRKMLQTCGKPYGNACYAGYTKNYLAFSHGQYFPVWPFHSVNKCMLSYDACGYVRAIIVSLQTSRKIPV